MKSLRHYLLFVAFLLLSSSQVTHAFDEQKTQELKEHLTELVWTYRISNFHWLEVPYGHRWSSKIRKLIDDMADPNIATDDELGRICSLHIAAMAGNNNLIEYLYNHGANISARSFIESTPLIYAAQNMHLGATAMLVGFGANVKDKNIINLSALIVAEGKIKKMLSEL